jgi:hypothetical protein
MPVVDTTTPFSNNEQITSTKLNNIMDNSFFVSGAVVSNQGLEVTAGGQMQIPNGGIKTALLETGAIDASKISTGGPSWTASSVSLPSNTSVSGTVTATGFVGPLTGNVTGSAITSGTSVTASGTSVDFTSVPTWAQKISLVLSGCSTSGSSVLVAQLGTSSGFIATGYLSYYGTFRTSASTSGSSSIGFGIAGTSANDIRYLIMTIVKISGNQWVASHSGGLFNGSDNFALSGGGNVTLSGTLDRIRLTTTNGTDTFDAGSVNIVYE